MQGGVSSYVFNSCYFHLCILLPCFSLSRFPLLCFQRPLVEVIFVLIRYRQQSYRINSVVVGVTGSVSRDKAKDNVRNVLADQSGLART